MKVDFFRVEAPNAVSVDEILLKATALPDDESRTKDIGGIPFRLQRIARAGRYWDGDMVRIRMDDVPPIVSRSGEEQEVDLDEDQGLGEETAFRYDSQTRVLAIQVHRAGVSATKWAKYLEALLGAEEAIVPTVVINPDAAQAITRLETVRKIHIRYAGNTDARTVINPGTAGTREQIQRLAQTAPVFEMTLGMGQVRGDGLPIREARTLLRESFNWFMRQAAGDNERSGRIDVVGTFDDESRAEMNLLEYVMRETVEVEIDPDSKRVLYGSRHGGVEEAWERRRAALERMFPARRR